MLDNGNITNCNRFVHKHKKSGATISLKLRAQTTTEQQNIKAILALIKRLFMFWISRVRFAWIPWVLRSSYFLFFNSMLVLEIAIGWNRVFLHFFYNLIDNFLNGFLFVYSVSQFVDSNMYTSRHFFHTNPVLYESIRVCVDGKSFRNGFCSKRHPFCTSGRVA